jgi:hypothetical protein
MVYGPFFVTRITFLFVKANLNFYLSQFYVLLKKNRQIDDIAELTIQRDTLMFSNIYA